MAELSGELIGVAGRDVHDLVIVGGGITGTAAAYVAARYSDLERVTLLEKYGAVARVNSDPLNNAQTSHDGGTETNYGLEHALEVKAAATMLRRYVQTKKGDRTLFKVTNRMVLGVGADEVRQLEERFKKFRDHYPDLRLAYGDELARIEPKVMEGRDPNQPVCALVSSEGFAINYQRAAAEFLADACRYNPKLNAVFNVSVTGVVRRSDGMYAVHTTNGTYYARAILFAAGSFSLYFAQMLGYGKKYAILPVAGSFYSGGKLLLGKVYRVQIEGMPFAAIHGDPDILDSNDTRFGPTTKPLPLMERHQYGTFFTFSKLPLLRTVRGWMALFRLLAEKRLLLYVIKNILYDLRLIGPVLFRREVKAIVPTIKRSDLKLRRGAGGIRPQIVNLDTGQLEMGDKTLVGIDEIKGFRDKLIFNTTPSPGASVCLANAKRDIRRISEMLGACFKKEQFEIDLERPVLPSESEPLEIVHEEM